MLFFRRLPSDETPKRNKPVRVEPQPKPEPKKGPLVLGYSPYTLEVSIPLFYALFYGYAPHLNPKEKEIAYWNSDAWRVHAPPYKNFGYIHLRKDIAIWCGRNLKHPYQACYRYPREGGTNYMAMSDMMDVFKFRCQMSEWNDDYY
jgi:hypothetical protein